MPLHINVNRSSFEQAFREMNRNYFSPEGYDYLFEMFDDLNMELDVIAICCDYVEHGDDEELLSEYGYMLDSCDEQDRDKRIEMLVERLEDATFLVRLSNGGYLVQNF